jgi:hypothetical protein
LVAVALFVGNWKRVMPRAVLGDPAKAARGFENEILVCPAHHMALAFKSAMELVEPRQEFNRVLAF